MDDYAIIVVHRHWPDILERAVESMRRFSDAPIVAVDDASPNEESRAGFWYVVDKYDIIGVETHTKRQHGLCLDMALDIAGCDWVFTADPDIIIHDERAFSDMLALAAADVGAIGWMQNNKASAKLGSYVHPYWALWNARVIKRHNLSFAPFYIELRDGEPWIFATAQFLSYRLRSLSRIRPWEAPDGPYRLIPFNLGGLVEHAQVWQERGDTWREQVALSS